MYSIPAIFLLTLSLFVSGVFSFSPICPHASIVQHVARPCSSRVMSILNAKPPPKISQKRRQQLGINEDEDEYDLYFALDNNTDPLITKLIAGSLIIAIFGLLVMGVIIPSLTDYGEGVCNPITTGGRC